MEKPKIDLKSSRFSFEGVLIKPNWEKELSLELVSSVDRLREILDYGGNKIAIDTETNGLNTDIAELVGFSFSFDGINGYYVPLKHMIGVNLDNEAVKSILNNYFKREDLLTIWFNYRFDYKILRTNGVNIDSEFMDVAVQSYVFDVNSKGAGLKALAKHYLGWDMETFTEVTKAVKNFQYTDARSSFRYAATDALATFNLYKLFDSWIDTDKLKAVLRLDLKVCRSLVDLEDTKTRIDLDFVKRKTEFLVKTLDKLESEIFILAGERFNVRSAKQICEVLRKLGISLEGKTEKGELSTNAVILKPLVEKYPIVGAIVAYRELYKLYSGYYTNLQVESGCFAYKSTFVISGRFSGGVSKKELDMDGETKFLNINIQNIPKNPSANWWGIRDESLFRDTDRVIRGFHFNRVLPEGILENDVRVYSIKGTEAGFNCVRRAFSVDKGTLWVSFDFQQQEVLIPAFWAGENSLIDAYYDGRDIHTEIAKRIFKKDRVTPEERKKAKIAVFGIQYGMSSWTLAKQNNLEESEAESIINSLENEFPRIAAWRRERVRSAEQLGYSQTYFGRRCYLRYMLSNSDKKLRGHGIRMAKNLPVQGTGGDIMRIALNRWYDNIKGLDLGNTKLLNTVHDEFNFQVDENYWDIVLPLIETSLIFNIPGWKGTLLVGCEIGLNWGELFSFVKRDGKFYPKNF